MFGIIIFVIVLLTMGHLILKNYKPQVMLAATFFFQYQLPVASCVIIAVAII